MATPTAGLASQTPAIPGQPINAIAALMTGGYIQNPADSILPLYIDPTGPAANAANGTSMALYPGQTFHVIPNSTLPVSVASDDANHPFIAIQWV